MVGAIKLSRLPDNSTWVSAPGLRALEDVRHRVAVEVVLRAINAAESIGSRRFGGWSGDWIRVACILKSQGGAKDEKVNRAQSRRLAAAGETQLQPVTPVIAKFQHSRGGTRNVMLGLGLVL
ncbi:hypothetical protein DFH09DRAFT_1070217 [Mycena vulgaris]|nr:hypothetical protein DFH09DRAFT_1070217 [Mycena vulgaris]